MTKMKAVLTNINVLNTQFVKRNNSLTLQPSMVPANIREQITQAILSYSPIVTTQREHPHCLVPDRETKYVFRRSDPNAPMAEELQRGYHFSSIQHLLNEVRDVMNIIRNFDTSVDVDERIDEVEQGPNVQIAMNNGEQKGVNKRSHDTMIVPGHGVHSSLTENISATANAANLAALQSVTPTARIRTIQDVAVPASQSSSSIPVAQATTATAQVIHLVNPTAADASHPVALATPVNPAFPRMPSTSIRSAIAPSAYLAEPEHPFSPLVRQNLRYYVSRSEVLSQDDFYGNPCDSYNYRNPRFAKGEGKGNFPKEGA